MKKRKEKNYKKEPRKWKVEGIGNEPEGETQENWMQGVVKHSWGWGRQMLSAAQTPSVQGLTPRIHQQEED